MLASVAGGSASASFWHASMPETSTQSLDPRSKVSWYLWYLFIQKKVQNENLSAEEAADVFNPAENYWIKNEFTSCIK